MQPLFWVAAFKFFSITPKCSRVISLKKLYHLLREHPDISTPEGRSRDRYRRVTLTSATMIVSRFLNVGVGIFTIPIVAHYLNGDLYGIWMLLTNFIGFLIFADLGIGMGFQNHLIKCYSEDDREMPAVWVTNTLVLMILLGLIVVALSIWAVPLLPLADWMRFKEDPALSIPWLIPSAQALGISFAIGLPGMMCQYIGNAYQRGYWPQLLWMIGRFVSLVGTIIAAWYQQPLPVLIAVFVAPPYIMMVLGLFIIWSRTSLFRPAWRHFSLKLIGSLFQLGGSFFINRITFTLQVQGPSWVAAIAFSATEAGYVATAAKILQLSGVFYQPLVASLYPALGEAVHRSDWKWVSRVIRQVVSLQLACNAVTVGAMLLFGNWLFRLLLDNPTTVPLPVFLAIGLHVVFIGLFIIPMTVLNAMNHLRYQIYYGTFLSILPFALITWLCRYHVSLSVTLFEFLLAGTIPFFMALCIDFLYFRKRRMKMSSEQSVATTNGEESH